MAVKSLKICDVTRCKHGLLPGQCAMCLGRVTRFNQTRDPHVGQGHLTILPRIREEEISAVSLKEKSYAAR